MEIYFESYYVEVIPEFWSGQSVNDTDQDCFVYYTEVRNCIQNFYKLIFENRHNTSRPNQHAQLLNK